MVNRGHILTSICYLLIGVIGYMHVCSAWCAVVADSSCCSAMEKEGSDLSCCSHHKDANKEEKSCQDFHLAFFKAAGQFSSEKNVDVVKVFPLILAEYPNLTISKLMDMSENLFASNNYHPPPPIADIRTFIQSFQI